MDQPNPVCPICKEVIASATPVIFDHGAIAHLACYTSTEGTARLVVGFLRSREGAGRLCYTCLAEHLHLPREDAEKGVTALRLTRQIVVEPGVCMTCSKARVTVRFRALSAGERRA